MIKGLPPLEEKEERELVEKYKKTGDKAALDKLVLSNQGFVYNIAKKYYYKYIKVSNCCNQIEIDDLINIGNLGLIRGINNFNNNHKTRLLTYAGYWVNAFIELYVNKEIGHTIVEIDFDSYTAKYKPYDGEDNITRAEIGLILKNVAADLEIKDKLYICLKADLLPVSLTKEDLANIMLKPSVRSIDRKKNILEKMGKKKKLLKK